jgi:hypothetical protein
MPLQVCDDRGLKVMMVSSPLGFRAAASLPRFLNQFSDELSAGNRRALFDP